MTQRKVAKCNDQNVNKAKWRTEENSMYLKINHIDILTKEVLTSLSKPNTFKTYDLQKCSKEQTKNVTKFVFFF